VRRLVSSLDRRLRLPVAIAAVLVALRVAPPAIAQDTSQDTAAATGYSVRGTIVNAISGQPVARAVVSIDQDYAMLTGSEGEFSFDNVPAGKYSLSVQKPGYKGFGGGMGMGFRLMTGGRFSASEPPRQIEVGPDMPAVAFPLTPLATISGHVTLSTADPADGIQVEVFARQFQHGRATWTVAGQTKTRSDGSFRIAELNPGSYMVSTQASLDRPGSTTNDRAPVWGFPALYYPGVTELSGAGVIVVTAGQQAEADLTLTRQQFFPVTALVHGNDSPANFDIIDSAGRTTGLSARYDRREGVVHASVPSGTWSMEAHAYGRNTEWGRTDFQVTGAPVSFAISILPIPKIQVIIHRDFAANSDTSQPATSGPGMNLSLVPADGLGLRFGGGLNQDGDTEWLNVSQPGRYWVEAQAFPPTYINSITSGGTDLGSNPLAIIPGSDSPPIEVTLRNDAGTITGQIAGQTASATGAPSTSGEVPRVWIYAIPLFSTAGNLPEGSMQSGGQFTIPDVAPGSYRVVACDAAQEIDFHSTEGLAAWAGKGQTVTVDPGGTASVELEILHTTAAAQ
jgi:hypothetical protein